MLKEEFLANDDAAFLARRALSRELREDVHESALANAALVVSELIGGVLRCEPRPTEPIRVTAERHGTTLRVTVQDQGPERGSSFECPDDRTADGIAGRLLRGLSEAWGFERINGTTIAWSEFPAAPM
jgi:anti-sigma regulatory factor (Ser/Thr protein kinase)